MGERRGLRYIWRTVPRAPANLFDDVRDVHPAMVQVMYTRGLEAADLCADFLAGVCRDPDDPHLLMDVNKAVERLVQAQRRGEQVAVFTDYDADGVNSAAVLATGLRMMGIEPRVRLPNRFVDGYGLTEPIVEELAKAGANVIITADCGSTAHARRRSRTSTRRRSHHYGPHQCPAVLPNAFALVNPGDSTAGIRATTCAALGSPSNWSRRWPTRCCRPAARPWSRCSTWWPSPPVADIMPCWAKNRRLVLAGLNIMNAVSAAWRQGLDRDLRPEAWRR